MNRAMGMQVNHHGLYVGGAQPVEAGAGNDGRGGGMLEGGRAGGVSHAYDFRQEG